MPTAATAGLKNILDNLEITLLNIEHYSVGTEWNYRNVNSPYSRIYYITAGQGLIQHHRQEFVLRPGYLYLIPCFTTVNLLCQGRFSHYYIHFTARMPTGQDILSIFKCHYEVALDEAEATGSLLERLARLNPDRQLFDYDANKPLFSQIMERAARLDQTKPPDNLLQTNALLRLLLASFFLDYDHPRTLSTLHGMTRFDAVLDHIESNLGDKLSIEQLARIANLNPTYFSNLFNRLMGMSPVHFINKRRVQEAQKLLLSTDHTLYHIARQVGFSDEYYLSRVFKKSIGIAPNHYRKQAILSHQR